MEVPGFNPLTRQIQSRQQSVPDLILDVPRGRPTPPSPATMPHQAPAQPLVQHTLQNLTNALMEMNIRPTPQTIHIAQTLANYGQAINHTTMQVVQQALSGLSDKSAAAVEAVVILLSHEKPVNPETVRAMKQLLNGQPLPEQLQHLQKDLGRLVQQLRTPESQAQLQQEMKISQQIVQTTQGGEAAKTSIVQQVAGHTQAITNREDSPAKAKNKHTAEKIQHLENKPLLENQTKGLNVRPSQEGHPRSLEQIEIALQHKPSAEEMAAFKQNEQLLKVFISQMTDLSRLFDQLLQSMVLKNYQNLPTQLHQLTQLVGILQYKLGEFRELYKKLFPDLAYKVAEMANLDGMDLFSRLAHLIEEGNDAIRAQLKYAASQGLEQQQLSAMRTSLEQMGSHIEKIHAHLAGRELLVPNQSQLCIPFVVSANKELYPAELVIQSDAEQHPSANKDNLPIQLSLTLETKNLGRVNIEMTTLQKDMSMTLKVMTRRVKLLMEERLTQLKTKLEKQSYQVHHLQCRVEPDLESRHSMLLPPKQIVRSLKRVEGIV